MKTTIVEAAFKNYRCCRHTSGCHTGSTKLGTWFKRYEKHENVTKKRHCDREGKKSKILAKHFGLKVFRRMKFEYFHFSCSLYFQDRLEILEKKGKEFEKEKKDVPKLN